MAAIVTTTAIAIHKYADRVVRMSAIVPRVKSWIRGPRLTLTSSPLAVNAQPHPGYVFCLFRCCSPADLASMHSFSASETSSATVHDPHELRVTRVRALRGPNYWRLAPVVACDLALGSLDTVSTAE